MDRLLIIWLEKSVIDHKIGKVDKQVDCQLCNYGCKIINRKKVGGYIKRLVKKKWDNRWEKVVEFLTM